MRALFAVVVFVVFGVVFGTGCSKLLGITDPSTGGDGGVPGGDGPDSAFDAPPPCTTSPMFGGELISEIGFTGSGLAVGRLDRVPGFDVAVAAGDRVIILGGDRAGRFAFGATLTVAADQVIATDVDDGDDDIIAWQTGGSAIHGFLQDSSTNPSTWGPAQTTPGFSDLRRVVPGFFDGNFYTDLVVGDSREVRAYRSSQLSQGTFSAEAVAGGAGDELVGFLNVDRAGQDDVLLRNGDVAKVAFREGTGYATPVELGEGADAVVVAGQFDGDLALREVITAQPGALYRQVSPRVFAREAGVAVAGLDAVTAGAQVVAADLNGDGAEDLIRAGGVTLQCAGGAGAGGFTQVEALPLGAVFVIHDLDGDTKLDLAWLDGTALKVRLQQ